MALFLSPLIDVFNNSLNNTANISYRQKNIAKICRSVGNWVDYAYAYTICEFFVCCAFVISRSFSSSHSSHITLRRTHQMQLLSSLLNALASSIQSLVPFLFTSTFCLSLGFCALILLFGPKAALPPAFDFGDSILFLVETKQFGGS